MSDKLVNNLQTKLSYFGISFEDYNETFGGLIGQFKTPYRIKAINPQIEDKSAFYSIANAVFEVADTLINHKASLSNCNDYKQWKLDVGELRSKNFKLAIYEEIKMRCLNNDFPEFTYKKTLISTQLNLSNNQGREFSLASQFLSSISLKYLQNSAWETFDIKIPSPNSFSQYLDKETYLPLIKDLIAKETKLNNQQLENIKKIQQIHQKMTDLTQKQDEISKKTVQISNIKSKLEMNSKKIINKFDINNLIVNGGMQGNMEIIQNPKNSNQWLIRSFDPSYSNDIFTKNIRFLKSSAGFTILDDDTPSSKWLNKYYLTREEFAKIKPPDITKSEFEKEIKNLKQEFINQITKKWIIGKLPITKKQAIFISENKIKILIATESNNSSEIILNAPFYDDSFYIYSNDSKYYNFYPYDIWTVENCFQRLDINNSKISTMRFMMRDLSKENDKKTWILSKKSEDKQEINIIKFYMNACEKQQFDKLQRK